MYIEYSSISIAPFERVFFLKHFFDKYKKSILFPGIGGTILCFFLLFNQGGEQPSSLMQPIILPEQIQLQDDQIENIESKDEVPQSNILVDVKGAVKVPGVYSLMLGDRVIDAITMAGGYTVEANSTYINHAQKVVDEMVIYVPKVGEDISIEQLTTVSSPATSQASSGKVNLNAATESDLTTLPGIGPAKAKAIIEYREQNGRFKSVDDLKNVSGIGEKTFEKLKQYIEI